MNITELRYLVAIMQWGSVSAAAKQLYAAQPNISKALKNLEEEYKIRIFERSSTGMIPTEQGRRFIEQAERVLEDVDLLSRSVEEEQERCAELRVMLPHATYASYAAVDYLEQAAHLEKMHIHIREGGSMEALDFVLRRGYHLALLRYAMEDDEHYSHYCARRGLKMEPVMDFEYQLLTNRDGPLAKHEVHDLAELNQYMEILHDDFQLPALAYEPEPPHPCVRAVQPVLDLAAAAHGLHVGVAHAPQGAGAVPSGAEKVPGPAPADAGCSGLSGQGQSARRGTGICRSAPETGGPDREMSPARLRTG